MSDSNPDAENSTRTTDGCDCCGGSREAASTTPDSQQRWIGDADPLAATLPSDVRAALGRLLGAESVETIGEWVREIRRRTGGGAIGVADLCFADEETPHRAEVDGETHHFLCFYDAVALAGLSDATVDIRTESPDGTAIEARAAGTDELSVTPGEAVFSFGVDRSVDPPSDGDPAPADIYRAVCPYVTAFPDRAAYESWAASVDAATVAMPLAGATELATALIE